MKTWIRQSGSAIGLKDTQEMCDFAESKGWKLEGSEDEGEFSEADFDHLGTKDEIAAYVLEKTGLELDKRGGIDTVRDKAKEALVNWKAQDQ